MKIQRAQKAVQTEICLGHSFERAGARRCTRGKDEPQLIVSGVTSTDLFEHDFDEFLRFDGLPREFD